ncbi:MAG: hypothetical protein ACI8QZ_002754 [Chlamydiales bacterium]|jgi:hypothetical protein
MKFLRVSTFVLVLFGGVELQAQERLPIVPVGRIELQPFRKLGVERTIKAMATFGSPLKPADVELLAEAVAAGADGVVDAQRILDSYALCALVINPESRVKVLPGPASRNCRLIADAGRNFLVKVINEGGVTAALNVASDEPCVEAQVRYERPMADHLSGLELEYCVVSLVGRSDAVCAADLAFDVGAWSRDLVSRSSLGALFYRGLEQVITLDVKNSNGNASTGCFVVRDDQGAVFPPLMTRVEPDFHFHDQVYRADGETLTLPYGTYTVTFRRGPESVPEERILTVDGTPGVWAFQETRWVDTQARGYRSIDHHVHPAGCSHYSDPNCGVTPLSVARHCEGEDLNAEALIWGPCYDYQKDFLTGDPYSLNAAPEPQGFLGYGLETSGMVPLGIPIGRIFGHIFLLGLESTFQTIDDFPTLATPLLRWAEDQGAVIGYAHAGAGMHASSQVPSYIVPPVNSIGAVSCPVYVTESPVVRGRTQLLPGPGSGSSSGGSGGGTGAARARSQNSLIDLLGVCNTSYSAELNLWYHLLSCGFRLSIAGETDFPCIYDDRIGRGRTYVKTEGRPPTYRAFLKAFADGRSYVSTGECHLIDFRLTSQSGPDLGPEVRVGEDGSTAIMATPGTIDVEVDVSALLDPIPAPGAPSSTTAINAIPYWALERARVIGTREVDVELIVNGFPVATTRIVADGNSVSLTFPSIPIDCSSWVAVRVLGAAHTNAIIVEVGAKPVRSSKKSAQWCMDVIDRYLANKMHLLDAFPAEQEQAEATAGRAKRVFVEIYEEAKDDL